MKRYLTEKEIEYVLSDICALDASPVSQHVHTKLITHLISMCKSIQLYPSKIDELKKRLTTKYYTGQVPPGKSVGIITAQSIGERQTQLTLNSFHSAGIAIGTVVTGVPRFSELLNATKKPKNVLSTIILKHNYYSIEEIRSNTTMHIKHVTIENLIRNYRVAVNKPFWYDYFHLIYGEKPPEYTWFIRLECNKEVLFTHRIHLKKVAMIISENYEDIYCVWSPDTLGVIDLWFTDEVSTQSVANNSNYDESTVKYIFMENVLFPKLNYLTISGVEGIQQVIYKNGDSGVWYIEALGNNLQKLLSQPLVDSTRTISNNMWEIYNVLGIEAAREFIITEFMNVISVDSYINIRHVELLVDMMLYTGSISSISRYGVHKNQSNALTKCSFEESLDHFIHAGIYGDSENITGVSGAIICGKISNTGTGLCDLVYNG